MRVRFRLLAALAVVTFATAARANNPAAAQALFEEGRTLLARGELAAACAKFEGSLSLDPAPGTEYNLALCYEKSGRTASAWATYLSAAVAYQSTQRPEWEAKARAKAAALAASLSKLTLRVAAGAPADLRVTRDGVVVGASELGTAIPVDPGAHVVEATAPGRAPWQTRVEVAPGAQQTVTIAVPAAAPAAGNANGPEPATAASASATPATPSEHDAPSSQRTWALVVGGVGALGLAVGAIGGLVAIGENSDSTKECPNDGPCASAAALRSNAAARDWATVSTVGFAGGGALVALGAALFLTAPAPHAPGVAPAVGLGTVGVRGAW